MRRRSRPNNADAPRSVSEIDFTPRAKHVFPSPPDSRDLFMYELMIDRFDDARPHPAFDSKRAGKVTLDPKEGRRFQGGKLRGITRRLDYLAGMGVNALWITPPLKNRIDDKHSYHGYGPQDFLRIDPRFGTLADFQEMVRQAHKRGIYVILDIVTDHAGDVFGYENDQPEYWDNGRRYPFGFWRRAPASDPRGPLGPEDAVWPIELQHPDAFKRMGRMRDVSKSIGDEAVDGDFVTFKHLDLENPQVLSTLIAIYKYWIAVADIDGFRIDAFRHIRPDPADTFTQGIHEYAESIGKKRFLLFGEVTGPDESRFHYIGSNTPLPEEGDTAHYPLMDATLDFSTYRIVPDVLRDRENAVNLARRFDLLHKRFRDSGIAGRYFVTFVENHDNGAGHIKRLLHDDRDDRLAIQAAAYLLCATGIPCWYYGSEQGFYGGLDGSQGTDFYLRECMFGGTWGGHESAGMHFFNPRHPIYRAIARLARIRRDSATLRYGRQYIREISENGQQFGYPSIGEYTLAFSRILDTDEILVALNISKQPRRDAVTVDSGLTPPGTILRDLLSAARCKVESAPDGRSFARVPLGARGVAILGRLPSPRPSP